MPFALASAFRPPNAPSRNRTTECGSLLLSRIRAGAEPDPLRHPVHRACAITRQPADARPAPVILSWGPGHVIGERAGEVSVSSSRRAPVKSTRMQDASVRHQPGSTRLFGELSGTCVVRKPIPHSDYCIVDLFRMKSVLDVRAGARSRICDAPYQPSLVPYPPKLWPTPNGRRVLYALIDTHGQVTGSTPLPGVVGVPENYCSGLPANRGVDTSTPQVC
ncbi:hypothetical protein C8Q79DRAFT_962008 [Trametes meyenii]|nr:hypothetical protein C8Q79DRAFT_962008 [Trametes meyenii]